MRESTSLAKDYRFRRQAIMRIPDNEKSLFG